MGVMASPARLALVLSLVLLSAAAAAAAAATGARIPAAAAAPAPAEAEPTYKADARVSAVIRLPNGSKAKSMAFGNGTDLFITSLGGEVFHIDAAAAAAAGDPAAAAAAAVTLAREPGTPLTGVAYDAAQHALFVAGSGSGTAIVYFLTPARPYAVARRVAVRLARVRGWQTPYANDVLLGPDSALLTDSFAPLVHEVPRLERDLVAASEADARGGPAPSVHFHRLGPGFPSTAARLNANGLVFARAGGGGAPRELLVSNFDGGYVARVSLPPRPAPGAGPDGGAANSSVVAELPPLRAAGHGLWPAVRPDCMAHGEAGGVLYLSDNFQDRVLRLQLDPELSSARVTCAIAPRMPESVGGSAAVRAPTALAFREGRLWVLNAHMLDCPFVLPCKGQAYEIVGIDPAAVC